MGLDEDRSKSRSATRLRRQEVCSRPGAPSVIVVLDEPVLCKLIGTPDMRENCSR